MTWAKCLALLLSIADQLIAVFRDTQLREDGARKQRELDRNAVDKLEQKQDEAAANAASDFDTALVELQQPNSSKRD